MLIYSKEIAMIINRNSELEKNMYAKLSPFSFHIFK